MRIEGRRRTIFKVRIFDSDNDRNLLQNVTKQPTECVEGVTVGKDKLVLEGCDGKGGQEELVSS